MKDLSGIIKGVADSMLKAGERAGTTIVKHLEDIGKGVEDSAKAYQKTESDITSSVGKISSTATRDAGHDAGSLGKDVDGGGKVGGGGKPGGDGQHAGDDFRGGSNGGHDSEGTGKTEGASDPVDVVSGQMLTSKDDVSLPGLLPLTLRRAYASGYGHGRLFGNGWSSTLDQRLVTDDDGIHFLGDDAQVLNYPVPDADGREVLPAAGARWPLAWDRTADVIEIRDPFGGWSRRFTAVRRDSDGREVRDLTRMHDRNGNWIEFDRSEAGVPYEIRHSGGYRVLVSSAALSDSDSGDSALSDGDRVRVTGLRLADGSAEGVPLAAYGYDEHGRLTEITDSSGVPFVFQYDRADRITAWIDRLGYRYDYTYDDAGRVVRGEGQEGYLSASFAYDTDARVTTVTDGNGEPTEYHYDEHQHITAIVDALGHATRFDHDRYGREIARTDALGHTTRYEYDGRGDLARIAYPDGTEVRARYNALHQPVEFVDQAGSAWRYEFDDAGNLLATTDPLGARWRYAYDARGRLTSSTDASGNESRFEANDAGLRTAWTDPLGAVSRIERDAFGRAAALTDPLGSTTRLGYRPEGEALWRELPDGSREEWTYDAEGNQVRHLSPAGAVTVHEYGPMALRTAEIHPDGARRALSYDAERNLVQVAAPDGLTWNYEYAPGGAVAREVDFNGREMRYGYDAAGRLIERVNGAGQRAAMTRDALGRVTRRELDDGTAISYGYDRAGRLIEAAAPDALLECEYDAAGRVVADAVSGRAMRFRYDPDGRLIERLTPSGVRSAWSYDPNGQPARLVTDAGTLAMAYDPVGQEVSRVVGGGAAIRQDWDANYRLAQQSLWARESTESLSQRRYAYRPDGYPASVAYDGNGDGYGGSRRYGLDPVGRITSVSSPLDDEEYVYDQAGRIVRARWGTIDQAFQGERRYQGTRLVRAGRTRYEFDAQGRVIRKTRRTLSGQVRSWTFTWDADDRLTGATTPDGAAWRYGYDAFGRRVSKQRVDSGGGTPTYFAWHGTRLAEQTQAAGPGGNQSTTWDWDPGTDHRVVAQTRRAWAADAPQEEIDSEFHAIVTDWAGTPTELLSPDGRIDWRAETSVWGAPLAGASDGLDTRFPLGFPGQYHDSETGLDYNYLRYYDPEAARYVTPDPLGLFPQPDNYGYTSNPLIWTDPLGLAPHHATITVYDQHGQVKYGPYGMVSGHTVPEEKALGFPNSNMATHTEARAMRMHGGSPTVPIPGDPYANSHPVAPGDHIVIDGEKPPCPQCKGAMNRALRETGANVTYNWGGNAWHAS